MTAHVGSIKRDKHQNYEGRCEPTHGIRPHNGGPDLGVDGGRLRSGPCSLGKEHAAANTVPTKGHVKAALTINATPIRRLRAAAKVASVARQHPGRHPSRPPRRASRKRRHVGSGMRCNSKLKAGRGVAARRDHPHDFALAECPQPAKADVRAAERSSRFDPMPTIAGR